MYKIIDFKKGYILPAIIYIIAGLILLVCPEITTKTIAYAVAVIFLVTGVVEIISYLRSEPDLASTSTGFVNGVLVSFFGVVIFIKSEVVIGIIPVVLGFLIIVSGTLKLQHAINLYRIKMTGYKSICIVGLINIIIGIVTVFNPFKTIMVLMRVMGIGLILSGITDLISSIYMGKQFKKYAKTVEAKCIEEK